MASARPLISLISLIVLAGGILLQLLVILSGAVKGNPEGLIYFLESSTNGFGNGASRIPNPARWTYFAVCGVVDGKNGHCLGKTAALPFDPTRNFGTSVGVPRAFQGTDYYYLLSRFAWVFYLIALFFAVIALFLSVFALCARLGAYLTGVFASLACFFQALAASLMTAWTVKARNHLIAAGQTATLGRYAYGFTWAAFACFLISTVLFCVGGGVRGSEGSSSGSYFGRKRSTRSTRSRGSFADPDGQHRVKDDYE